MPKNPPSHPQLLEWLARDFIENDYDLHRLVRGFVSSHTYSRSSIWNGVGTPTPELFAVVDVRALTPMQYGVSLRVASNPEILSAHDSASQRDAQIARLENEARKWYVKFIEQPHEELQIGVNESLKLSNDPEVLNSMGDGLVPRLMLARDRRELIETAVWTILSRPPTAHEVETLTNFLADREPGESERLKNLRDGIEKLAEIDHAKLQMRVLENQRATELARLRENMVRLELARTSDYLAAAAEFRSVSRGTDETIRSELDVTLAALADRHKVETDILRQWLSILGFKSSKRIVSHFREKLSGVMGHQQLMGLGTIKTPNILINTSNAAATFNYGEAYRSVALPGRALAVHPSSTHRVAIGWRSPVDGTVLLDGRISDIDKSRGNGVSWSIELQRAGEIKSIASGDLENGKSKQLNSLQSIQVESGDLLSIIVDSRQRNDGCDTTQIEFRITEIGEQVRTWDLSKTIVEQPHANNPFPDRYGNLFVWNLYTIRDEGFAVPSGSLLENWKKLQVADDQDTRRQQLTDIANDLQKLLTGPAPTSLDDPECGIVPAVSFTKRAAFSRHRYFAARGLG